MDESYLVDGRQHFEDDDAIDRAMLDCFSETDQLDTMDYISAPSFSMMNNLFNQSHQRGSYPYGKDVAPPRKNNTSNCGMNNPSQLMPQINYNNGQYNSISNLTDCGLTSSSSESSLNQANMMKNQNQSPSIFSKLGNSMSPSNSNKRKLSATGIKSENAAIEAPPTKSELKSQLVIVSRERRRYVSYNQFDSQFYSIDLSLHVA